MKVTAEPDVSYMVSLMQQSTTNQDDFDQSQMTAQLFEQSVRWHMKVPSTAVCNTRDEFLGHSTRARPNVTQQSKRQNQQIVSDYRKSQTMIPNSKNISLHGKRDRYDQLVKDQVFMSLYQSQQQPTLTERKGLGSLFSVREKVLLLGSKQQKQRK